MNSENEPKPGEGPSPEIPMPPLSSEPRPGVAGMPAPEAVELKLAQWPGAAPKLSESFAEKHATGGKLSVDDFILLNEEIAGMARAGLPLDQGLATMAKEMGHGRLKLLMGQVAADMSNGLTLPQAIERQSGRVPAYYPRLLAAGLRTGRVGEVIGTLSTYARTVSDLRTMIISAAVYPIVVTVLALTLFGFLSMFLVPMFESIFRDFRLPLPGLTIFVMEIHHHNILIFVVLPAAIIGSFVLLRFVARSQPAWWRLWTSFWYNVPITGELLRSARLAAFADLLGILVDNSVPLPEAFLLAGQASSDPLTSLGCKQVHDGLSQGTPLGVVLRNQAQMPDLVVWMIGLGEKRGTLGATLHQVAEMYRRKVEMRIGLLRGLLPSFLVLVTVGTVLVLHVFAMFLPLISLIECLSGGGRR